MHWCARRKTRFILQKLGKSGSAYFTYKHTSSIVLMMAIADWEYKLLYVSVDAQSRMRDADIFNTCRFYRALHKSELGLPIIVPYMVVGDDAFPLTRNIMNSEYYYLVGLWS
jgi:hypothetical protein